MTKSSREARFRPTQALQRGINVDISCAARNVPRTVRERVERPLNRVIVSFEPPFRPEYLRIIAPYFHVSVNGITWHAQNRPLFEETVLDRQPSLRDNPGQADSRSRVHAKAFVYDGVKIREIFDSFVGRDYVVLAL